jgi:hypothetical protein
MRPKVRFVREHLEDLPRGVFDIGIIYVEEEQVDVGGVGLVGEHAPEEVHPDGPDGEGVLVYLVQALAYGAYFAECILALHGLSPLKTKVCIV